MRYQPGASVQCGAWTEAGIVTGRGHRYAPPPRRSGGIGRRAGLKIRWPQGRVGSSPTSGTSIAPPQKITQSRSARANSASGCPRTVGETACGPQAIRPYMVGPPTTQHTTTERAWRDGIGLSSHSLFSSSGGPSKSLDPGAALRLFCAVSLPTCGTPSGFDPILN